mmetsp:Transcript_40116/g.78633  ORF Transcript_40116/g.78633 Transcript_40116/m.78633 type:complete len:236 (+) Transcript_40116:485-1192(+)
MSPGTLVDELLEEESGGYAPSTLATEVLDVSDLALDLLSILSLAEGHAPHLLSRRLAARLQSLGEIIVVAPHTSIVHAEADNARPSQRGDVNNLSSALLLSVDQSISKRQPPLSVGIQDLDSLAVGRRQDVPRAHRLPIDHVLTTRHDEMSLYVVRLEQPNRTCGSKRRTAPPHVELHHLDHRSRPSLDVVPAAVERQPLAHDRHLLGVLVGTLGLVHEVDELGRLTGALGDCKV